MGSLQGKVVFVVFAQEKGKKHEGLIHKNIVKCLLNYHEAQVEFKDLDEIPINTGLLWKW